MGHAFPSLLLVWLEHELTRLESFSSEPKVKKLENPKFKEEEDAVRFGFCFRCFPDGSTDDSCSFLQLRKRFTEQVKMEEARFRQWGEWIEVLFASTFSY